MCPGARLIEQNLNTRGNLDDVYSEVDPDLFFLLSVQFSEQLISPKEFVCLAGKSTLKDWKRAIRLNGTMLRSELLHKCTSRQFYLV